MMEVSGSGLDSRNWRDRLRVSRDMGTGFAAPGGEFTRALFEWSMMPGGQFLRAILQGTRLVELGAGMLPYGYALATRAGAKNFVAVEPFYADRQEIAQAGLLESGDLGELRIPRKVVDQDMLAYLEQEPDNLLCILACGIEDCILPDLTYRKKVEGEIERVLKSDNFFISSHSDLCPQGLGKKNASFERPSTPGLMDRLCLYGRRRLMKNGANSYPWTFLVEVSFFWLSRAFIIR